MFGGEGYQLGPLSYRQFASFRRRAGGQVIDNLLIRIASAVIVGVAAGVDDVDVGLSSGAGDVAVGVASLGAFVAGIAYEIGFDSKGATLGKRALGITVVNGNAEAPGLKRAAKRAVIPALLALAFLPIQIALEAPDEADFYGWFEVVLVVSVGVIILGLIDYLWMNWDDMNQTLHDKMGGTYVVHVEEEQDIANRPASPAPTKPVPYWEAYPASTKSPDAPESPMSL